MNPQKKDGKTTMTRSYGISGFLDSEMEQEINAVYGAEPEKADIAHQVASIAGDFSKQVSATGYEARQKRREYRRKCRDYISERAHKEVPKPVGFIGGFIFMAVLSAIISFIVRKLMEKYFNEQEGE